MLCSSPTRWGPTPSDVNNWPGGLSELCPTRYVWASDQDEELATTAHLVQKHRGVAIDTEFPGGRVVPTVVPGSPNDPALEPPICQYPMLRGNANLLKLIQLGFSFLHEDVEPAPNLSTPQFVIFNLEGDDHADYFFLSLAESAIQLGRHRRSAINPNEFSERGTRYGIVTSGGIKGPGFCGPYDQFKVLTGPNSPQKEAEFFRAASHVFSSRV
ncbi:CCR4-NOT transcription complex subunit 7-like [Haemaphysalis longicornis]